MQSASTVRLIQNSAADGYLAQRTNTTPGQKTILAALALPEPPRVFDFTPPSS